LDVSGYLPKPLPFGFGYLSRAPGAEFCGDDLCEPVSFNCDSPLPDPNFVGDLIGGQGGDEEAEEGVRHSGVRDDDAG
jgi:hypothetical protein